MFNYLIKSPIDSIHVRYYLLKKVKNIKNKLYKVAFLYLKSESQALDAVDEAVYKALKSIKKLRNRDSFISLYWSEGGTGKIHAAATMLLV